MAVVKKFQHKDRRLLNKTWNVLEAIRKRDLKAVPGAPPSTAISFREVFFDIGDAPTLAALALVNARLLAALAEKKIV